MSQKKTLVPATGLCAKGPFTYWKYCNARIVTDGTIHAGQAEKVLVDIAVYGKDISIVVPADYLGIDNPDNAPLEVTT